MKKIIAVTILFVLLLSTCANAYVEKSHDKKFAVAVCNNLKVFTQECLDLLSEGYTIYYSVTNNSCFIVFFKK